MVGSLSRYGGWRQSNGLLKQHPNVRGPFPLRAAVTTFLVNNKIAIKWNAKSSRYLQSCARSRGNFDRAFKFELLLANNNNKACLQHMPAQRGSVVGLGHSFYTELALAVRLLSQQNAAVSQALPFSPQPSFPRGKPWREAVWPISKHLKKGERVKIAGLGILQVRESGCPHGPQSHDRRADPVKASKKVAFRAAKDLKMAI